MDDRTYLKTVRDTIDTVVEHNRPNNGELSMHQKNTNMHYFLQQLSLGIGEQLEQKPYG